MKSRGTLLLFCLLIIFTPFEGGLAKNSKQYKFLTITTGTMNGLYFPIGGAICRIINKEKNIHNIQCSVQSTAATVFNINALRNEDADMALVQTDWQYYAVHGQKLFSGNGPMRNMRSLMSLYEEYLTVVVRADSGIKSFNDIKGKKVNLGNPGSGVRATMNIVMEYKKWTQKDFLLASKLSSVEQPQALCDGKIDVAIFNLGHPSSAMKETAVSCDIKIIPVTGEDIDKLIKDNPFYSHSKIPGGLYAGNHNDISTIGMHNVLVATSDLDESTAYHVVKSVMENFEMFVSIHPVFDGVSKADMANRGYFAPLHAGAIKYYREQNLLEGE